MGRLTEAIDWLTREPEKLLTPRDRDFHYHYLDESEGKRLREKYKLYKKPLSK